MCVISEEGARIVPKTIGGESYLRVIDNQTVSYPITRRLDAEHMATNKIISIAKMSNVMLSLSEDDSPAGEALVALSDRGRIFLRDLSDPDAKWIEIDAPIDDKNVIHVPIEP